jgi:hypothetical protein
MVMTFRRFLYRIGLAPAASLVRQRGFYISLLDRGLEREDYLLARIEALQAERDALRAENTNLKRAGVERLRDEGLPFDHEGWERFKAGPVRPTWPPPPDLPDHLPPMREWRAPFTTGAPLTAAAPAPGPSYVGTAGYVDCLEGDKPRAG